MNIENNESRYGFYKSGTKTRRKLFLITSAIVAMTFADTIENANAQNIPIIVPYAFKKTMCLDKCKKGYQLENVDRNDYDIIWCERNYRFECEDTKYFKLYCTITYTGDNSVFKSRMPSIHQLYHEVSAPKSEAGHYEEESSLCSVYNDNGPNRFSYTINQYTQPTDECIEYCSSKTLNFEISAEELLQHLPTPQKTITEIISELNADAVDNEGMASKFREAVGNAINGMDFTKFYDPNWIVK